jgi:serine/threonine-protein kinase
LVGDAKPGLASDRSDESAAHKQDGAKQSESSGASSPSDGAWAEPETLQRLSSELASYIGPIAELVVKRAALGCSSVEDLCRKVAQEIESQAERKKFLAAVRG